MQSGVNEFSSNVGGKQSGAHPCLAGLSPFRVTAVRWISKATIFVLQAEYTNTARFKTDRPFVNAEF
jgi:hypothetical protein